MVCYVIGAGETPSDPPRPGAGDLVIAADAGLTHAHALGMTPALTVGDFDSLGHLPEGGETVRLPVEKDDTDMAAAIGVGRGRGYRRFYLLGGTGGRPDHTYANYQLLADCARRGEEAILFGVGFRAAAIADGARLTFPADATGTLSVFSACGEATGVSERGVYYPLSGATLSGTFPLGVSNHFLPGEAAEISVGAGVLLVFFEGNILPEFS